MATRFRSLPIVATFALAGFAGALAIGAALAPWSPRGEAELRADSAENSTFPADAAELAATEMAVSEAEAPTLVAVEPDRATAEVAGVAATVDAGARRAGSGESRQWPRYQSGSTALDASLALGGAVCRATAESPIVRFVLREWSVRRALGASAVWTQQVPNLSDEPPAPPVERTPSPPPTGSGEPPPAFVISDVLDPLSVPVAEAGGPYVLNEADVVGGLLPVMLDGSGSAPGATGDPITAWDWTGPTLARYEPFDGTVIDGQRWLTARASQDGRMIVTGNSTWGASYAFSADLLTRGAGTYATARITPASQYVMWGLKNTGTNYSYTQMPYAIYFADQSIYIFEDGSQRGGAVQAYVYGRAYDVRIELKPGSGARYFFRPSGVGASWVLIYDSNVSAATQFRVGMTVHNGTQAMDDVQWNGAAYAGESVAALVAGPGDVTLTVTDSGGRTASDTAPVTVMGSPPVADAGGPYEELFGRYVIFDGRGSTDDVGIVSYEWDFGDGTTATGPVVRKLYSTLGTFAVTLIVRDFAGNEASDATSASISAGVVCVPWRFRANGAEVPHETWDGRPMRLKAVFFGPQPVAQLTYQWNFGDGTSQAAPVAVSDKREIETAKTYSGATGALYTATVTVRDSGGNVYADTYPVRVLSRNLDVEVNTAIDEALWFLHKNQEIGGAADGRWATPDSNYNGYYASSTASAIQAFEVHRHLPGGDVFVDPYVDTVQRGFDFLFTTIDARTIGLQGGNDPDTNGNGLGISVSSNRPIYEGGMVMDAIAASDAPDRLAFAGGPFVGGRTYRDIAQDMLDQYCWGQVDSGFQLGGWRYGWNSDADNSACQWAAIGMLGAEHAFGLQAPPWVHSLNLGWLGRTQGGGGYYGYGSAEDAGCDSFRGTTPSGMVQLAWNEVPTSDLRWQRAERWISGNWLSFRNSFDGGNVYGWYAFAKAMRLAFPQPVTTIYRTPPDRDAFDWYRDSTYGLAPYIVSRQQASGGWTTDNIGCGIVLGSNIATAWQTIILSSTIAQCPPTAVAGESVIWAFDVPLTFDGSGSYHDCAPEEHIVLYEWDFDGDGNYDYVGVDPVATHTYAFDPGITYPHSYSARLRVTDDGEPIETDTDERLVIIAEPPHPPVARLSAPLIVPVGVPVQLDATASFDIDPGDYITQQDWDLDGGNGYSFDSCTQRPPGCSLCPNCENCTVEHDRVLMCLPPPDGCLPLVHTFTSTGTFNIAVRVWDAGQFNPVGCTPGDDCTRLCSTPVFVAITVVDNHPPTAALPDRVVSECEIVVLDASGSSDPDGDALTYTWDLDDDGAFDDAVGPAPTYAWPADGVYAIHLRVSDGGFADVADATITVLDLAPTISISGPAQRALNQAGCFAAIMSSPCDSTGPIEWDWDYVAPTFEPSGDTGLTACHAWDVSGAFVIAARVVDSDGDEALATWEVSILSEEAALRPHDDIIQVNYVRRGYLPESHQHYAYTTLKNIGQSPIRGPIILAFAQLQPAGTTVLEESGRIGDERMPFVDFTSLLGDGLLSPGEETPALLIHWQISGNPELFSFDDRALALNAGPRFVSTPITAAAEGALYTYASRAVDPENDPLIYQLVAGPAGMLVNPGSGVVSWRVGASDAGPHEVRLRASDGYSDTAALQVFTINVADVNVPPQILSTPRTTALAGEAYAYPVVATDADGDPIAFALEFGPSGMTLDTAGLLRWPSASVGTHSVRVAASDDHGHTTRQSYVLVVLACAEPPEILTAPIATATEGLPYLYPVVVESHGRDLLYRLDVAPAGMTIDSRGLISWTPSYASAGERTVKVVVYTDVDQCQAEQTYSILVANRNGVPQITSTPNRTAAEGVLYTYDVRAIDPDGDPVVYSLLDGPANMTVDPFVGALRWTPSQSAAVASPYSVSVAACDPFGGTGIQTWQIDVSVEDLSPRILSEPAYAAVESELYRYDVEASDPDGDPLEYRLTTAPGGMTIHALSGLIEWTPSETAAAANPHPVQVEVRDPGGHVAAQAWQIYVRRVNVAPEIVSMPPTSATEGEIYTYETQATDADGDALHFSFVQSPAGMNIHPTSGRVDWLVPQDAASRNPNAVTIRVSDGVATAEQSFAILAVVVNVPPVITSTPGESSAVGGVYRYDVSANDPDGDVVRFELTQFPPGMTIDPASGRVDWAPAAGQAGPHEVAVRAFDPAGLDDSQSWTIEVAPCDDAPQFTSAPRTVARADIAYAYDVNATVRAGTISYALSVFPPGMAIDPTSGEIDWTPTPAQLGLHDVTVVATRDALCPSEQSFRVDVRACELSTSYVAPTLVPGGLATFVPRTTANCTPLTYTLLHGPPGMVLNPTNGVLQWIAQVGPYGVRVRVADAWGTETETTLAGDVRPESPPQITSTPPFTAAIDALYEYDVEASDADGDTLTFSLDTAPSGMTIDAASGLVQWTPSAGQIGSHTVAVRAADGRGGWATQTYTLAVSLTGSNRPPRITSEPPFVAGVDVPYEYAVVATDDDGNALAYRLNTAPAGAAMDAGGRIAWTPSAAQLGPQRFEVRVDDGQGGWATQTYDVTVSIGGDNHPPQITSLPVFSAALDAPYVYPAAALDEDGDALAWSLEAAPAGMTISALGLIEWAPAAIGTFAVRVRVDDGRGGWATQEYPLSVSEFGDNAAPRIISVPAFTAQPGVLYSYSAQAVDDDGDVPSWSLPDGPAGMAIDAATGLVQWTPTAGQLGTHEATIRADDGRGGWATQTFRVTVSPDGSNRAPQFRSTPTRAVVAGQTYAYAFAALDEDGDDLSFTLPIAPAGMSIIAGTGQIEWPTAAGDLGTHPVVLRAEDAFGGWAEQRFDVTVRLNSPPAITSGPATRAIVGLPYRYDVEAEDADELVLAFDLLDAPAGMTIDALTGEIAWTPPDGSAGEHEVTVRVRDGALAEDTQTYMLNVSSATDADVFAPEVEITATPRTVNPGEPVTIRVETFDDFGVATVVLTIRGQSGPPDDLVLPLDADGEAAFTPAAPGAYVARAVATDLTGKTGAGETDFAARTPGDATPPVVAFASPAEGSEIPTPTDIAGTASDDHLYRYSLAYRNVGEAQFVEFAVGYQSVTDGVLGQFDPTMLVNGCYEVRLRAEDTAGNIAETLRTFMVTGRQKIGNFSISYDDLTIPLAGVPITLIRTYDSRDRRSGDFGYGWRLEFLSLQLEKSGVLGEDWEQVRSGGFFPTYFLRPRDPKTVSIAWPDGRVEMFETVAVPDRQVLIPIQFLDGIAFHAVSPSRSTLALVGSGPELYLGGIPGDGDLITFEDPGPWDANAFQLTTRDGSVYTFAGPSNRRVAKLQSVRDSEGNTLQILPNGMVHSSGVRVQIARDAAGRITSVTDPDGSQIRFEYDSRGDLVRVTDRGGNATEYRYNHEHGLIEIIDPRGVSVGRNIYDEEGRLIAIIDAAGNRIELEHDTDNNREIVRDRLGNPTIREYDSDGNITLIIDALGNRTARTYDSEGRVLTETDALGRVSTNVYNANGDLTSATDVEGNTASATYDSSGNPLTVTDPLGRVTTNEYDSHGNLTRSTSPDAAVTQLSYSANGNLLSTTDALGHVRLRSYDGRGNVITEVDPLGRRTTFTRSSEGLPTTEARTRTLPDGSSETVTTATTWDEFGAPLRMTDAYGRFVETESDATGKLRSLTDKLNRTRLYTYDAMGSLTRVDHADASFELRTYDAERREISRTDRDGVGTQLVRDALGRVTRVVDPLGHFTETGYGPDGHIVSTRDKRGFLTQIARDAGVEIITDPLGRQTRRELDPFGDLLSLTDALGHTTQFEYGALGFEGHGRLTRQTFDDGSELRFGYDPIGRLTSGMSASGAVIRYEYDAANQLIAVENELGERFAYGYDEIGNLISQTDPLGRVTRMEYDRNRMLTRRILPLGQQESFEYDAAGNQTRHVNFDGAVIQFAYDDNNRVMEKTLPGAPPTVIEFEHTPAGRVLRAGDDTFTYDARGLMATNTVPSGQTIAYSYDEAGNVATITTSAGTTSFSYDQLNRLSSVTDSSGGVSTYGYDEVGNRSWLVYPNRTRTDYTYDALNRLTRLATTNTGSGQIIASYDYTLDADGRRTRIVEHGGRVADYTYDAAGQVIRERILDPTLGDSDTAYSYDAAGNRVGLTRATTAERVSVAYEYDGNDRLLRATTSVEVALGPADDAGRCAQLGGPAAAVGPRASLGLFLSIAALSLLGCAAPFALLRRRAAEGRRWCRRREIAAAIALFLLPSFLVGPDRFFELHCGALVFAATAEAYDPPPVVGVADFTYDDSGNLLTRSIGSQTDTFTYDAENRLLTAEIRIGPRPASVSYGYDGNGNRVRKTVDGAATRYVIDKNRPLAQVLLEIEDLPGGGTQTVSYVYGDDLISMSRSGVSERYYHHDGLGSTRALSDASASVTDTYSYDAFGGALASNGATLNAYRFAGEQLDAHTGLYYLRARDYDPATGRFTARDPFGGLTHDPKTLHKYVYCANDPVNHVDPTGKIGTLGSVMISIAIVSVLIAISFLFVGGEDPNSVLNRPKVALATATALSAAQIYRASGMTNYVEWFGAEDAARRATVESTFDDIIAELRKPPEFDRPRGITGLIACGIQDAYAYVLAGLSRAIHLCGPFYSSSAGLQAGTVLHETQHVVQGFSTCDCEYGKTDCRTLATTHPGKAIHNADSYEYAAGLD